MARPATLVLVRHAESKRNEIKKGSIYFADDCIRQAIRGVPDHKIPITELGIRQSKETGLALKERFDFFDYVYNSGYLRTIQTMEHMLSAWSEEEREQMRVRANPFIRERDPGYAYDMTEEEAKKHFPWLAEYWKTFGGFFAQPVGGESLAQVAQRVYLFINMLFRDRAGMNILVVTHGGTLRCFRFLLEHWDYERALKWPSGESPKNCGVTNYEYDESEERLILRAYNSVHWK